MIERFGDGERGGFFSTSHDHEELIARRKDVGDHPSPPATGSAALGLLRLAALTGEASYEEWAVGVLELFAPAAVRHPDAFGHLLQALDFHLSPTREVALIAPAGEGANGHTWAALGELAGVVRSAHRLPLVLAGGAEEASGPSCCETARRSRAVRPRTSASGSCRAPVTTAAHLEASLG